MSNFRDYKYNLTKVTAIITDTTNSNYVWLAFSQNTSGNCLLKKVSANDLNQVYFTVTIPVSLINALAIYNGYIAVAVTHSTIFSYWFSITNPLTTWGSINKPVGVDESPIGIGLATANVYFLTPGILSSEPAKLVSTDFLNNYVETIVLQQSAVLVREASAITVDASDNIWVATNTNPAYLIRVWNDGSWELNETVLIA